MQEKILLMYSGGLDSAGAFWELLTNPLYQNYIILVHHIHILNHENRALAEQHAVSATLPHFQSLAPNRVYYSSTTVDFRCLPFPSNLPFDTDIYGFMAGNLAIMDPGIRFIASGSTADDAQNQELNRNFDQRRDALISALYLGRGVKRECRMLYPVEHKSSHEIFAMLPAEIRDKTWSCRRPAYKHDQQASPCRVCHSCIKLAQIRT